MSPVVGIRVPARPVRFLARVLFTVALLGAIYVTCWLLPDRALPRAPEYQGWIFEPGQVEVPTPRLVEATAYCACPICCGKWSDGFTAAGTRATEGRTVAADPAVFALGTCLAFPALGSRVVEDTGSAIVGPRIDVYFDDHGAALRFGRRALVALKLPC